MYFRKEEDYFRKEEDYYLIYDHDMSNKSLPIEGWFHNCIFCNIICGSTIEFDNIHHAINLQCCKDCKKSNKIEFNRNKISLWIDKHIPKPHKKFFCNCN